MNRIAPRDTRTSQPAPDWRESSACLETDPEVFYPQPGDTRGINQAKEICRRCLVRQACLDDALAEEGGRSGDGRHGIRGGRGPSGRRNRYEQIRKQQQRAAA